MGGRGSAFLNFYNAGSSSDVDIAILSSILENYKNDEDTKLEHKGYTKILKDKHIHIKESTDKITEDILIPNAQKIQDLTNKYTKTTKVLDENETQLRVRADKLRSDTDAMFVHNPTNFNELQLIYNQDYKYYTKERLESNTIKQITSGYWTNADKEELVNHTVTHEYGHFMQRVLMQKDSNTKEGKEKLLKFKNDLKNNPNKSNQIASKYCEDYAEQYIKSIQRIARKEYGREYEKQAISRYSKENNREFFAELFCNLNTNKNTDKDLAKAMDIYLKRRLG